MEKWDKRFLDDCLAKAKWSKDTRTQVGAVLVSPDRKQLIYGYNGFPRGVEDRPDRYENRELKHKLVIHAEHNAILTAQRDLQGYTLYCSLRPCIACSMVIIQVGIKRVVYPAEIDLRKYEDYLDDWRIASMLMAEAGIKENRL